MKWDAFLHLIFIYLILLFFALVSCRNNVRCRWTSAVLHISSSFYSTAYWTDLAGEEWKKKQKTQIFRILFHTSSQISTVHTWSAYKSKIKWTSCFRIISSFILPSFLQVFAAFFFFLHCLYFISLNIRINSGEMNEENIKKCLNDCDSF